MRKSWNNRDTIVRVSVKNIILNLALSALKITAGLITNSIAVLSDGLNSFSDIATTATVLFSRSFTNKPDDADHPYGHEKIESVVAFLIAVFLGFVALYTACQSVINILNRATMENSLFALVAALISAGVKFYMYRSTKNAAKKENSDMLYLMAVDYRFDILLSASVFTGVLMAMLGLWFFEPVAAIAASVILLISAWGFMKRAFDQVVDKSADDDVIQLIMGLALSCPGIKRVDKLNTRQHGQHIFVDIDISVSGDITVKEGHDIAEVVHKKLEGCDTCKIKHCNVHVNPL